ncbi:MAG: hypothetical protein ACI8YQ_001779 [Polaribacter sp.]|jgi:hypothetical protein
MIKCFSRRDKRHPQSNISKTIHTKHYKLDNEVLILSHGGIAVIIMTLERKYTSYFYQ